MKPARMFRDALRGLGAAGLALVLACGASAQDTARVAPPDTLSGAGRDTAVAGSPSGIDSAVSYTASDSIIYAIPAKTMMMYGKASIRYKELSLKAEQVAIDWNSSTLTARGVADSTDSTGHRGLPVMETQAPIDAINQCSAWLCFRDKKEPSPLPDEEEPMDREAPSAPPLDTPTPYAPPQPYIAPPRTGRNDPCPCGSGRKYKKCCGK